MIRTIAILTAAVLLGFTAGAAAESAAGTWNLLATDEGGSTTSWTLVVKDDGGKLSGTLTGPEATFALIEPKLEGQRFTFQVKINEMPYQVETKIDGKQMEGKFKGPEASGTLKATRQD
jgi:hypothetical protein